MTDIAAFLVVLDKHVHPEQAEATMNAVRQLKGVIGIRTLYNDAGEEIQMTRGIVDRLKDEYDERQLKYMAEAARDGGAIDG